MEPSSGAILLCGLYHVIVVRGGIGVDMERLIGASGLADCVPLVVHVVACSIICCCLCAIMSRKRVWAREQNLSRMVFVIRMSLMGAVVLVLCVLWSLRFH